MTPQEHLEKICTKCRELLAIAEKRTPGKWLLHDGDAWDQAGVTIISSRDDGTSSFIAACAGPAEAGWRATIAAIEGLQECYANASREEDCNRAYDALNQIIAAWPEELL